MGLSNITYQVGKSPKQEYKLPPVVGVVMFKNDVLVQRARKNSGQHISGKRNEIMEFTQQARKRLAFVASNTEVEFEMMITLTYPADYCNDGRAVKRHFHGFLAWLREQCPEMEYLWFLEFQKRGAPHYHILVNVQPVYFGSTYPMFQVEVSQCWNKVVRGDHDHLLAGTRTERLRSPLHARHYAVKYAMKPYQKAVPALYRNVGRFYGYSRGVKPKPIAYAPIRWDQLQEVLKDWPYLPDTETELRKVLFNTSGTMAASIEPTQLRMDFSSCFDY